MRMIVSLDSVAARLFAVLSLVPLAAPAGCGGNVGGGGGDGGGGAGGGGVVACEGAQPIVALGQDSGYVQCEGGWRHREEVVQCASALPRTDACGSPDMGGDCTTDADCTAAPHGHCSLSDDQAPGCFCQYGCVQDSDCAEGQICFCSEPVGYCATASCTSDADCGGDKLCSTYITLPGCGGFAYACQTASDQCASDADCPADHQCTMENGARVCAPIECVIGRPFLVGGEARQPLGEHGPVDQAGGRVQPVQPLDAAVVFAPLLAAQHQDHQQHGQLERDADLHAVGGQKAHGDQARDACQREGRAQHDGRHSSQKPQPVAVPPAPCPQRG